jgi:hypothetical protein
MDNISKTQTFQVPVNQAILTPQSYNEAVEKAHNRVVGIALLARGATSTQVRVKIYTDNQVYLDWAPLPLYAAGTDYPVMDRFIPMDIKIHGQNFYFDVQMITAGTGTGTIDVVFALGKKKEV